MSRPECEMYGCNGVAEGIGDIGGDEYWLCGTHRYPVPDPVSREQAIEAAEDRAEQVAFDAARERS